MRLLKEILLGDCPSGTKVLCDGTWYVVLRKKENGYIEVKNKSDMLYSTDDLECCIPDHRHDIVYNYRPDLVVITEVV